MKRLVLAVAAGVVGLAMAAGAATDITNWATGTYQLAGAGAAVGSGIDSAIVHFQSDPTVVITKWAYNTRTGDMQPYTVNAVSGDVIQFTINWAVTGEATADTIVIRDYVPSGLTVVGASNTDTEANCTGSSSIVGSLVSWTNTGDVPGTDPGPAGDGVIKFNATVN